MASRNYHRWGKGSPKGGQFAPKPGADSAPSPSRRVDDFIRRSAGRTIGPPGGPPPGSSSPLGPDDRENVTRIQAALAADLSQKLQRPVEVRLQGASPELAAEIADMLSGLAARYPNANLGGVQIRDLGAKHRNDLASTADGADGSGVITFNAAWMGAGRENAFYRALAHQVATKGMFKNGTDAGAVAAHEFGHVLDFNTAPRSWRAADPETGRRFLEDLDAHLAAAGVDVRNPSQRDAYVTNHLSSYAVQDMWEMFAEAFGDYVVNGPQADPLSRMMVERMHRALGRGDQP